MIRKREFLDYLTDIHDATRHILEEDIFPVHALIKKVLLKEDSAKPHRLRPKADLSDGIPSSRIIDAVSLTLS